MDELTWKKLRTGEAKFLTPLINDLGLSKPEIFLPQDKQFTAARRDFNGLYTLKGIVGQREVGVLYNDFKIKGGSFGKENSSRMISFIHYCQAHDLPIIFMVSSFGVRMMEGRSVFKDAFSTLPALREFIKTNTLITISVGRCLGIGAIFFALGDYRIALEKETVLNLTGPEVFKLFFGESVDFKTCSTAKRNHEKSGIVHHIASSKLAAYRLASSILNCHKPKQIIVSSMAKDRSSLPVKKSIGEVLSFMADEYLEVFPLDDQTVRTFIIRKDGYCYGGIFCTPGRPNMIKTETLKRIQKAMSLFKKLALPLISLVDTPGADPRIEENDKNIIGELINTCVAMIDYPYPRKGIISGRCFGGASVLTFPTFMGGEKTLAIDGSSAGVMNENIITHLLSSTPRLYEEWQENRKNETDDLDDFKQIGILEKLINWKDVPSEIHKYLSQFYQPEIQEESNEGPMKLKNGQSPRAVT